MEMRIVVYDGCALLHVCIREGTICQQTRFRVECGMCVLVCACVATCLIEPDSTSFVCFALLTCACVCRWRRVQ